MYMRSLQNAEVVARPMPAGDIGRPESPPVQCGLALPLVGLIVKARVASERQTNRIGKGILRSVVGAQSCSKSADRPAKRVGPGPSWHKTDPKHALVQKPQLPCDILRFELRSVNAEGFVGGQLHDL